MTTVLADIALWTRVTRENVQGLRLAWAWAMESGLQEPEPIVYRGVMYLPHTHGVVQALVHELAN